MLEVIIMLNMAEVTETTLQLFHFFILNYKMHMFKVKSICISSVTIRKRNSPNFRLNAVASKESVPYFSNRFCFFFSYLANCMSLNFLLTILAAPSAFVSPHPFPSSPLQEINSSALAWIKKS